MNLLINLFLGMFVFVCLLMVLVILMQRPKSEGLGAAFGAAMTENIFGAQTTNVLTKITTWLAGIFFVLTFSLSVLYAHKSVAESGLRRELAKTQSTTQGSPSPASPQPSPASSPAPDSGAGVLPPGSATPATSASPAAQAAASPAATPVAEAASPTPTRKPKGKRP